MSYYYDLSAALALNEKGKKSIKEIQEIIDSEDFHYAIAKAEISGNNDTLELLNSWCSYNEEEVLESLNKLTEFIELGEVVECRGEDDEHWHFVLRKKLGKNYWEEEHGQIVYEPDDPLDKFCKEEAKFRLAEVHEVPEEEISEELIEKTATTIRNILSNWEPLFDFMDVEIAEVLKKHRNNKNSD